MPHFFIPSSHPRFYRSRSLYLLWLHGILSQRWEIVCTIFICLFFWGGHFNAFGVLEHVMNAVTALRSTETSVTLHQSTGRNLHQHLCENVMSHRLGHRAGPSYCVTSLLQMWRLSPHSQKPHNGHIFHSVHYDILKPWLTPINAQLYSLCILSVTYILKLWLTPISAQLCSLCILSITCRS